MVPIIISIVASRLRKNFSGTLLLGSLPGIWIGSHIASKVPEKFLRSLLATMLIIIGTKLVLS